MTTDRSDDHIPLPRLVWVSREDVVPEAEELNHLTKCRICFDLMTAFIQDRRDERLDGATGFD
jgi:hypothetical protein